MNILAKYIDGKQLMTAIITTVLVGSPWWLSWLMPKEVPVTTAQFQQSDFSDNRGNIAVDVSGNVIQTIKRVAPDPPTIDLIPSNVNDTDSANIEISNYHSEYTLEIHTRSPIVDLPIKVKIPASVVYDIGIYKDVYESNDRWSPGEARVEGTYAFFNIKNAGGSYVLQFDHNEVEHMTSQDITILME
jgi:hypothetical protein